MKVLILTCCLLFCSVAALFAQSDSDQKDFTAKGAALEQVVVKEGMQLINDRSQNALTMAIPSASNKKCEEVWKEFSKDFNGKTRKDKKTNLYFSDDASLTKLSGNAVDVYAKFDGSGSGTIVTVWFDLGGSFLASEQHEDAYQAADQLIRDYASAVKKSIAEDYVKEQEKVFKILEKDLEKLGKDNESYRKKIEEAKKLIAEMEQNIQQNLKDQEKKQEEIKTQGKVVEQAKEKVKAFN